MPELSFADIELSAGGVILRRKENGSVEVLLIEDSYGNWGFPKGHVEGGETSEEAALRECREETGLRNLRTIAPIGTTDWYFRSGRGLVHKFCDYFLLQAETDGQAQPQRGEGIRACAWLNPDETFPMASTTRQTGIHVPKKPMGDKPCVNSRSASNPRSWSASGLFANT